MRTRPLAYATRGTGGVSLAPVSCCSLEGSGCPAAPPEQCYCRRQKAVGAGGIALHFTAGPFGHVFEKMSIQTALIQDTEQIDPLATATDWNHLPFDGQQSAGTVRF
jgi:hypothetical protein